MKNRSDHIAFIFLMIIITFYLSSDIFSKILPADDGYHALAAERVLSGEIPHVDYIEHYVGGISYLNAFVMSILGVSIQSIRIVQFFFVIACFPLIYWILRQFCTRNLAWIVTVLCSVWTLPSFPVVSANWYCLFLYLASTASLIKFYLTTQRKWIFIAGFIAGLGLLFKTIFLYFIFAGTLSLFYWEQETSRAREGAQSRYLFWIKLVLLLFCFIAIMRLALQFGSGIDAIYFCSPLVAISWCLLVSEWSIYSVSLRYRLQALSRILFPFWLSFIVAPLLFLTKYAIHGHLSQFFKNLYWVTTRHLLFTVHSLPLEALWYLLGMLGIVFALEQSIKKWNSKYLQRIVLFSLLIFVGLSSYRSVYHAAWQLLRAAIPTFVIYFGFKNSSLFSNRETRVIMFTLACVLAFMSLLQIPWAILMYLVFLMPLLFTFIFCFFSAIGINERTLLICAALLFGWTVLWVNRAHYLSYGPEFIIAPEYEMMNLSRGRLTAYPSEKDSLEKLVAFIDENAKNDEFILAFPDCPQVYFLSGKKSPTRHLYDFASEPPTPELLAKIIESKKINIVVISSGFEFSRSYVTRDIVEALGKQFKGQTQFGQFYVFYSKETKPEGK